MLDLRLRQQFLLHHHLQFQRGRGQNTNPPLFMVQVKPEFVDNVCHS